MVDHNVYGLYNHKIYWLDLKTYQTDYWKWNLYPHAKEYTVYDIGSSYDQSSLSITYPDDDNNLRCSIFELKNNDYSSINSIILNKHEKLVLGHDSSRYIILNTKNKSAKVVTDEGETNYTNIHPGSCLSTHDQLIRSESGRIFYEGNTQFKIIDSE
jgi:hypothetical protein